MSDQRSFVDRIMDYVDRHLGGTVTDRQHKSRRSDGTSGIGAGDSSGPGTGFDDCAGDGGGDSGGDCGGGGGGGGGGD
jgi:hypothetical protein